jgi:hypothetical protein
VTIKPPKSLFSKALYFNNLEKRMKKTKLTIGRRDKANFPELNLQDIDIKIDTGAYTSAIHCHQIGQKIINGKQHVVFTLLDPSHPQYDNKEYSTKNFTEKRVKNSFGGSEKRFVVKTNILLFGQEFKIRLSLSERGEMRFPILIGRKFLVGKFIVDPAKCDLSFENEVHSEKSI